LIALPVLTQLTQQFPFWKLCRR